MAGLHESCRVPGLVRTACENNGVVPPSKDNCPVMLQVSDDEISSALTGEGVSAALGRYEGCLFLDEAKEAVATSQ